MIFSRKILDNKSATANVSKSKLWSLYLNDKLITSLSFPYSYKIVNGKVLFLLCLFLMKQRSGETRWYLLLYGGNRLHCPLFLFAKWLLSTSRIEFFSECIEILWKLFICFLFLCLSEHLFLFDKVWWFIKYSVLIYDFVFFFRKQ